MYRIVLKPGWKLDEMSRVVGEGFVLKVIRKIIDKIKIFSFYYGRSKRFVAIPLCSSLGMNSNQDCKIWFIIAGDVELFQTFL